MFFLVTGASGAGKSTVREAIAPALSGHVEVIELATLGVTPEWSLRWRHRVVEQAVQRALEAERKGRHFLLCGDPVPPGEVIAVPSGDRLGKIDVCLLDVSADAHVIDTTELPAAEVARQVLDWIQQRLDRIEPRNA